MSYPVKSYDLELALLAFGDETKAHVTMLFLDLSENKMGGNRALSEGSASQSFFPLACLCLQQSGSRVPSQHVSLMQ